MRNQDQTPASFHLSEADAHAAVSYAGELLGRHGITGEALNDAKLVFEALLQELSNQGFDEDTEIEVSARRQLGGLCLFVGFEGKVFSPPTDDDGNHERFVLRALGDKVSYNYAAGYNSVRIAVARSYRNSLFLCTLAAVLALIVYLPINFLVGPAEQDAWFTDYVLPLEQLYINAILMVGAPVTLFSLLKNLTDTYIVSERHSGIRRLQMKTVASSVFAVLLAVAVAYFLQVMVLSGLAGYEYELGGKSPSTSFAEVVPSLVPSGIFQPFDDLSPIPLIALSLLITYALCSVGKYFDIMKTGVDACYALFSRMLYAVIAALPFFCFVALVDVLLDSGYPGFVEVIGYLAIAALSPVVLLASYAIRLRARGIKVTPFAKKLFPLLRENFKIGSAIAAAPFNIRYCAEHFGMDRARLSRIMPVLAEINLDGNCFLLMLIALLLAFFAGVELSPATIVIIGLLVLFLSLGAPNQPGSILIGSLIIATYLNTTTSVLAMVIYVEAFLGSLQNLINVTGDIVMATLHERDA